jgi:hypothetical protein
MSKLTNSELHRTEKETSILITDEILLLLKTYKTNQPLFTAAQLIGVPGLVTLLTLQMKESIFAELTCGDKQGL